MPNRILKESICYSDDIDKLSAFEETVFYRLIVKVDDYGRIDGRPGFLKSTLFVTKNGISEKNVSEAVARLASLGLVRLYEVDGKPFLCLPKWHLHQRVRDSKEKYPAPSESGDFTQKSETRGNSPQLAATCGNSPPVSQSQSQSESQSESNPSHAHARASGTDGSVPDLQTSRFDDFWSAYPKKVGKAEALKAWKRIKPDADKYAKILDAVALQKDGGQWKRENGRFIPNPATWLNQGRWDDEVTQAATAENEHSSKSTFDEFIDTAYEEVYGKQ
jgi:hypothetical protein